MIFCNFRHNDFTISRNHLVSQPRIQTSMLLSSYLTKAKTDISNWMVSCSYLFIFCCILEYFVTLLEMVLVKRLWYISDFFSEFTKMLRFEIWRQKTDLKDQFIFVNDFCCIKYFMPTFSFHWTLLGIISIRTSEIREWALV